jgi:Fe-S-cluster containining protein
VPIERTAPEVIQDRLEMLTDGTFCFACHPGVSCFTECCRDLKLLLTPFDILRLKTHLHLDARAFLDQYTESRFDDQRNLPMIYLKMLDDSRKRCPFVSRYGCRTYEDRPAACRIYPLAKATRLHRVHKTVLEEYFVLRESHCHGFKQDRLWVITEWIKDQGLERYHEWNNPWMDIVTHPRLRSSPPLSTKQQQMFFLASYNLDKFREFVLESRFFTIFETADKEVEALRESDESLLRLSFSWLKFSLFNEPTLKMRRR